MAIREGRQPRASGELAFHIFEVMDAIAASPEAGGFLDVSSRCARPDLLPAGFPDYLA